MPLVTKPEFLLVGIVETVRDEYYGFPFLAVSYIMAREKFVAYALLVDDAKESTREFMQKWILYGMVLDLCTVMAFAAALGAGNAPPALLVGYMVTSLGMLLAIASILFACYVGSVTICTFAGTTITVNEP